MSISELEQRVLELGKAMEQSIANHNALVGRMEEAKHILDGFKKAADAVEMVSEVVSQVV